MAGCPLCGAPGRVVVAGGAVARLVRCRSCRLLSLDPPPEAYVRRHYDDVYADDAVRARIDRGRQALFAWFLREVPPFGAGRLLDVGCGSGEFLDQARARGWRAEGIEVSAGGAAVARRRGLTVHVDAGALPDGAYDVITLWNVVDFFPQPLEQMREISRLMAPGGLVFLRTPNAIFQLAARRLSRLIVWPPALARLVGEAHFFQPLVWAPDTLRLLLTRAGFTGVRMLNSPLSQGDPYRGTSPGRDRLVADVKRVVHAVACGVRLVSGGRLLVGPSICATARKP
jgi:SAM-dependent methyltransferase